MDDITVAAVVGVLIICIAAIVLVRALSTEKTGVTTSSREINLTRANRKIGSSSPFEDLEGAIGNFDQDGFQECTITEVNNDGITARVVEYNRNGSRSDNVYYIDEHRS